MSMLRLTKKSTGLPVWLRAASIISAEATGTVTDPRTEVIVSHDSFYVKVVVEEAVDHVGEMIVATEMYGQVEPCEADASTLGVHQPCLYPRDHQGPHSWEVDVFPKRVDSDEMFNDGGHRPGG